MSGSGHVLWRSIGIAFSDGGLLTVSAVRPANVHDHGEEILTAVLCDPDAAPVEAADALLSTEYGPDGVQRRATLEVWVGEEDPQPMRGAGTLISAVPVRRPGMRSTVAFFRWSMEGREGLGHYETVWRDV